MIFKKVHNFVSKVIVLILLIIASARAISYTKLMPCCHVAVAIDHHMKMGGKPRRSRLTPEERMRVQGMQEVLLFLTWAFPSGLDHPLQYLSGRTLHFSSATPLSRFSVSSQCSREQKCTSRHLGDLRTSVC